MSESLQSNPAKSEDIGEILHFLEHQSLQHRHLDWGEVTDWVLSDRCLLLKNQKNEILGLISIPFDPRGNTWIRLFAVKKSRDVTSLSRLLFFEMNDRLFQKFDEIPVYSIAVWQWYENVLIDLGFTPDQSIVTLEKRLHSKDMRSGEWATNDVKIQNIAASDHLLIHHLDNLAFAAPWQLGLDELLKAIQKSEYATCVYSQGLLIAYQLCSLNGVSAHINRIAVNPENQKKGVGKILIRDIYEHFSRKNCWSITVNTQADNYASLALYHALGFENTDENFPVYKKVIEQSSFSK